MNLCVSYYPEYFLEVCKRTDGLRRTNPKYENRASKLVDKITTPIGMAECSPATPTSG